MVYIYFTTGISRDRRGSGGTVEPCPLTIYVGLSNEKGLHTFLSAMFRRGIYSRYLPCSGAEFTEYGASATSYYIVRCCIIEISCHYCTTYSIAVRCRCTGTDSMMRTINGNFIAKYCSTAVRCRIGVC